MAFVGWRPAMWPPQISVVLTELRSPVLNRRTATSSRRAITSSSRVSTGSTPALDVYAGAQPRPEKPTPGPRKRAISGQRASPSSTLHLLNDVPAHTNRWGRETDYERGSPRARSALPSSAPLLGGGVCARADFREPPRGSAERGKQHRRSALRIPQFLGTRGHPRAELLRAERKVFAFAPMPSSRDPPPTARGDRHLARMT